MAFLQRRERHEAASLLEFKVSRLRLENTVHTEQATPCSALGACGDIGRDAGPAEQRAGHDASPKAHS